MIWLNVKPDNSLMLEGRICSIIIASGTFSVTNQFFKPAGCLTVPFSYGLNHMGLAQTPPGKGLSLTS